MLNTMGAKNTKPAELSNVYIFNKIENNKKDIELLRETFESLDCTVTEIQNQSYDALKKIVRSIVQARFTSYNYIVLIILDNTNEEENIWITTDGKRFHINGDLLIALYANRSLLGKLRFSVIQMNREFTDTPRKKRKAEPQTSNVGQDLKFYATSTGCSLKHQWNNDFPSPFIKILCEEITQNSSSQSQIVDILNRVTDRVADETDELPSKEINFTEPIFLGNARTSP